MAKKYNRKIDVIIPAYNVPDKTLFQCLSSIACQDLIEHIQVTIVDDASTNENYENIANIFKPMLKIEIIRSEVNGGPGVARQIGLDKTTNGYVTFIDADDTFAGAFALRSLRNTIEQNKGIYVMSVGVFDEVQTYKENPEEGPLMIPHVQDMIWMFAKMYRRSFLDKYNIRFHPTSRANEDKGFNELIKMYLNEKEQVAYFNSHIYFWHENLNSITKKNDKNYSYSDDKTSSFYGMIENSIYVAQRAKETKVDDNKIIEHVLFNLIALYVSYIETIAWHPEYVAKKLEYSRWFYKDAYTLVEDKITKDILNNAYYKWIINSYKLDQMIDIIPDITFYEFLEKIRN